MAKSIAQFARQHGEQIGARAVANYSHTWKPQFAFEERRCFNCGNAKHGVLKTGIIYGVSIWWCPKCEGVKEAYQQEQW